MSQRLNRSIDVACIAQIRQTVRHIALRGWKRQIHWLVHVVVVLWWRRGGLLEGRHCVIVMAIQWNCLVENISEFNGIDCDGNFVALAFSLMDLLHLSIHHHRRKDIHSRLDGWKRGVPPNKKRIILWSSVVASVVALRLSTCDFDSNERRVENNGWTSIPLIFYLN